MRRMLKEIIIYHGTDIVQTTGNRQRGADNAGFSLIEVMIGVLIFSIGVLAIFGMQLSGIRGNSTARHYTETATIGVDKIEELIALPYTDDSLKDEDNDGVAGLFDVGESADSGPEDDPAGRYTIFWNVADDDLVEHSKTVSVIILWSGTGMQRSVSMQRVIPEII